MPCLKFFTNLPRNKVPSDFIDKIIPILSKTVKKPQENFICLVTTDCSVSYGGESKSPGAIATLESIGHLGKEENKFITKELSEFVEKELGISSRRFFLTFYDVEPHNVAIRGTTVEECLRTGLL